MERFVLTDAQWAKMEPHCLGKPGDPGRSGKNNRLFVEAVLWIARTGGPLRSASRVRPLEQRIHALPRLGEGGRLEAAVRCRLRRSGRRIRHARMLPSVRSTATVRAQKADSKPSDWPLERRHDQNPCAHRCARQSRLRGRTEALFICSRAAVVHSFSTGSPQRIGDKTRT
jgi:transposase